MSNKVIQVFEHSTLKVGNGGFEQTHFDTLSKSYDEIGSKYFDLGHKKIRFKQYVGVIQVKNLVIEILPKLDSDTNTNKWRNVLLDMLNIAGSLKIDPVDKASLDIRKLTLIDLFFKEYINEAYKIVKEGKLKRYGRVEGNLNKVKGKIIFDRQLKENLMHKERVYCSYSEYNTDNVYNQLLKKALTVLDRIASNMSIQKEAHNLLECFDGIGDINATNSLFQRLEYNRKTERYRTALDLAKLIILNYCPDFKSGNNSVLSIMFDMNELFERYIFKCMHKAALNYSNIKISAQLHRRIWSSRSGSKRIRPDIIVEDVTLNKRYVLDTKWKIPNGFVPSDDDLKQIYVYNMYFGSSEGILLYPSTEKEFHVAGHYEIASSIPDINHSCALWLLNVVNSKGLNRNIGQNILDKIMNMSING